MTDACGWCENRQVPQWGCKDCRLLLCTDCRRSHTLKHSVVNLQEYQAANASPPFCPFDGDQVSEYYCMSCKHFGCSKCLYLHQAVECNLLPVDKVAQTLLQEFEIQKNNVKCLISSLEKEISEFTGLEEQRITEAQIIRNFIDTQTQLAVVSIQRSGEIAKQALSSMTAPQQTTVREYVTILQSRLHGAHKCCEIESSNNINDTVLALAAAATLQRRDGDELARAAVDSLGSIVCTPDALLDKICAAPTLFRLRHKSASAVLYGEVCTVMHCATQSFLHSRLFDYPCGTRQQVVSAAAEGAPADKWRVVPVAGVPLNKEVVVKHGDVVRVEHVVTGKRLHSHGGGHHGPVTRNQQEVTCYGGGGSGDSNDNWRVELVDRGVDLALTSQAPIRLIHVNTNQELHSHEVKLPAGWGMGHWEVTAHADRDDLGLFMVTTTSEVEIVPPSVHRAVQASGDEEQL